jgi:hypothetical protein
MIDIKPKEEPIALGIVSLVGAASCQDYDGSSKVESNFLANKGWRIELYPRARIIRVWNTRLAQKGPAQVTTIPVEAALYWLAAGDVEHAPAEAIKRAV